MYYNLNIKAALHRHGKKIKDVAAAIGMTSVGLSYIINGQTKGGKRIEPNPGIYTLQKIATAIGCDLFDLFDDTRAGQNAGNGGELYGVVEYKGKAYRIDTPERLQALADIVNGDRDAAPTD